MFTTAILAFLANLLPQLFQLGSKWMDVKQQIQLKTLEYQLAKQNIELQAQNLASQERLADLMAAIREGESIRSHDDSLDGVGFIGGMRALVRPLVTYLLVGLWAAVKVTTLIHVWVYQQVDFLTASSIVMDEPTYALLSAVLGFWFGSRVLEKMGWSGNRS